MYLHQIRQEAFSFSLLYFALTILEHILPHKFFVVIVSFQNAYFHESYKVWKLASGD